MDRKTDILLAKDLGKYFADSDTLSGRLGLGHSSDGHWAIKDFNLSLGRGETCAIIGRNGSGKTTLLSLFAGIFEPTTGTLSINGASASILDLAAGIQPEFTGMDNLETLALLQGWTDEQIRDRHDQITAFTGLGRKLHEPCRTYSAGMLLRLGIAVALAGEPELLIVDEGFSVGDNAFQLQCRRRILDLLEKGSTLVLAGHDLDLLCDICTDCVWLEAGKILQRGPAWSVISEYREFLASEQARRIDIALSRQSPTPPRQHIIKRVALTGERLREEKKVFQAGAPLFLNVELENPPRDKGPIIVGLALRRCDGLLLWGSNMARESMEPMTWPYPTCIRVELPGGELAPGEYFFDVSVSRPDETQLQLIRNCAAFAIIERGQKRQEGVFRPKHRFLVTNTKTATATATALAASGADNDRERTH